MEVQLILAKLISHYINLASYTQSLPYEELHRRAIEAIEAELRKLKRRRYQVRILADSTVIVDADNEADAKSKVQHAITKGTSPYIAFHLIATQLDNTP